MTGRIIRNNFENRLSEMTPLAEFGQAVVSEEMLGSSGCRQLMAKGHMNFGKNHYNHQTSRAEFIGPTVPMLMAE